MADLPTTIHNERRKLLANAMNTGATSSFTVGVLAPMAAVFYNVQSDVHIWALLVVVAAWMIAAVSLHLAARWVLGGLRE